jgi:TolA-binding protein
MTFRNCLSATSLIAFSLCGSCGALESMDEVEKSTTAVGLKMDETNGEIEETNKKIDETNTKMDEMKREMGEMNGKLIETNQRMETMNKALDRMYQDLRQGDALAARLQTLEAIEQQHSLKSKVLHAAQYFMSFEYQLWKGDGIDDSLLRDIFARDAVDEFSQTIRRFAKTELPVSVLLTDNNTASLQALALTSHILNSNAVVNGHKHGQLVVSMHELLRQALVYGNKVKDSQLNRADIPLFAQFALRYPELVKYVFELRINMFPALLTSNVSQMDNDSFMKRWFSRASSWLKPWEADLSDRNFIEIEELQNWMSFAVNDLKTLQSLGLTARVDPALIRVLSHLEFVDNAPPVSPEQDKKRSLALSDLKSSIDQFIKSAR